MPTQSLPVSPPPMTITCLPLAVMTGRWPCRLVVARDAAVLLGEELHRQMHAAQFGSRARQRPRRGPRPCTGRRRRTGCAARRPVMSRPTSTPDSNLTPSAAICSRRRSMTRFLQLEVGNAVAQQAADAVVLLEDAPFRGRRGRLLRGGQPGRARSRSRPRACRSRVGGRTARPSPRETPVRRSAIRCA